MLVRVLRHVVAGSLAIVAVQAWWQHDAEA
jgi:hypothetical protein